MNTVCSDAFQDTSRARQDHAQGLTLKRRTRLTQTAGRVQRPDHWIYLDRWWATRLGVTRTAGTYRIRSRDLIRRLSQDTLAVDAAETVLAWNGDGSGHCENGSAA
jgi:thymidylate kinase